MSLRQARPSGDVGRACDARNQRDRTPSVRHHPVRRRTTAAIYELDPAQWLRRWTAALGHERWPRRDAGARRRIRGSVPGRDDGGAEQGATASRFSPNSSRNGTSKVEQQRLPPTNGLTMTSSPADLMRRNLLEVLNDPDPARRAAVIAVTYAAPGRPCRISGICWIWGRS